MNYAQVAAVIIREVVLTGISTYDIEWRHKRSLQRALHREFRRQRIGVKLRSGSLKTKYVVDEFGSYLLVQIIGPNETRR